MASDDIQYCIAYRNGESWADGPYSSLSEAKEALTRYRAEDDEDFHIHAVRTIDAATYLSSIDEICEHIEERAFDDGCGVDDGPRCLIGEKDRGQAQTELEAWARKWIEMDGDKYVGKEVAIDGE